MEWNKNLIHIYPNIPVLNGRVITNNNPKCWTLIWINWIIFHFVTRPKPLNKKNQICYSIINIKGRHHYGYWNISFPSIQVEMGIQYILAWCTWLSRNSLQSNEYYCDYLTPWVAYHIQLHHALHRHVYIDSPPEICFRSWCVTPDMGRCFRTPCIKQWQNLPISKETPCESSLVNYL